MLFISSKIYVTTFSKYNSGSAQGSYLDPQDYYDREDSLEACQELHRNEESPEFMFTDFPEIGGLISESDIDSKLWDILALSPHEREIVAVYSSVYSIKEKSIERILGSFEGTFDSHSDFAEEIHYTRNLDQVRAAEALGLVIDWHQTYLNDLRQIYLDVRHNDENWYFSNQ